MRASLFCSLQAAIIAVLCALAGCSSGDDKNSSPVQSAGCQVQSPAGAPVSSAAQAGNIHFDHGLSPQERGAILDGLDYLDSNRVMNPDPSLLAYMHISSFDPASVRGWLEDRVQYVVSRCFDTNSLVEVQAGYNYPNPGVFPPAFRDQSGASIAAASSSGGSIVMANIGALIYLSGKADNGQPLIGVPADGLGTIAMTSPRSGVLETGDGLFLVPPQYPNVAKIFHLTTLIHESHHSDGNGETAGFLHAVCPSGDYQGIAACDHNLNGPYEIEAMALKAYMNACTACSVKEEQILRALYLDTASRRIDDAGTSVWDDTPEGRR